MNSSRQADFFKHIDELIIRHDYAEGVAELRTFLAQADSQSSEAGRACKLLAFCHRRRQEYPAAHEAIDRAIAMYEAQSSRLDLAISLQNKAAIYYVERELDRAIETNQQVIHLFAQLQKDETVPAQQEHLQLKMAELAVFSAFLCAETRRFNEAENQLNAALAVLSPANPNYCVALLELAIINFELNPDYNLAQEAVDKAIRTARRHSPDRLAEAYQVKGRLHLKQNHFRRALPWFDKAAGLPMTAGFQINLKLNRAQCLQALGELTEAETLLNAVIAWEQAHPAPWLAAEAHFELARLYQQRHERELATAAFTASIAGVEDLQAMLIRHGEIRSGYAGGFLPLYEAFILYCLQELKNPTLALEYVERARSRLLVDLLLNRLRLLPIDRAEYERLAQEISKLSEELASPTVADEPPSGQRFVRLQQLRRERDERERHIETVLQRFQLAGSTRQSEPGAFIEVADLQRDLTGSLVEYFVAEGRLFALVVDTDSCTHFALGDYDEVKVSLAALRRDVTQIPDTTDAGEIRRRKIARHLQQLGAVLTEPLRRRLRSPVTIVPYDELHFLPFHALGADNALGDVFSICYAPSSKVYQVCRERARRFSPRRYQAVLVGVADAGIPQVAREIAALEKLFARVIVLTNAEATRENVLRYAGECDYLHISAHAWFRADRAMLSAIQLYNGLLTAADVFQMQLNCRLVTLSACETARHQVLTGDELVGLTRGFLHAGAAALLMSLWRVDDVAAARLMPIFYRHLLAGQTPDEALRQAQRELRTTQPDAYYWAPFVVMGA